MDKGSVLETKKAALKETIVQYLSTCKQSRCFKDKFWNEIASFQGKALSHKHFGVSKMKNLLEEFTDIVRCEGQYVCLVPGVTAGSQNTQEPEIVSTVDSDGEEGLNDMLSSMTFTPSTSKMYQRSAQSSGQVSGPRMDFRANIQAVLRAEGGRCNIWKFLDCYQSAYGPVHDLGQLVREHCDVVRLDDDILTLLTPPVGQNTGRTQSPFSSTQWGSGVAAVPASSSQSYQNSVGEMKNSTSKASSASSDFIPFSDSSSKPASQGQPSHQRYGLNSRESTASPQLPSSLSAAQCAINPAVSLQAQGNRFMQPFLMGPQPPLVMASATHALQGPPASHRPIQSEWPKAVVKTGPPPGTKVTDDVKEVVVRPIILPRGARLTADQVNLQVQECIDTICEAREHVSLDWIESLLLQKYQVRNFRELNLRERTLEYLPSGKEHSMKLGKVNAYIQNFVRSRSLFTLYELKECCREFHPEKKNFDHLKLGPLQKMPLIFDVFKFPPDEYIPEITSTDILEHLHNFLNRTNKWTQPVNLEEFMKFLVDDVYKVTSAFSLGVRLRSLPLAIQMMKKSQRDAAATRRQCTESLKELLNMDVQTAFTKFRAKILQTSTDGSHELRLHYMNLSPEDAVREILTKFELLSHILLTSNTSHTRKLDKVLRHFDSFVQSILEVPIPRTLFHLSVCMSDLQLHDSAQQFLEQEMKRKEQAEVAAAIAQQAKAAATRKQPPTKVSLADKTILYLNKCLEQGALQLSHLQRIEAKLLEDFSFPNFQDMGYGSFLTFLLGEAKIKKVLEECGGTMLGASSGSHDAESLYKPSHLELLEFICQAKHAGVVQSHQFETALCEQYHVTDVKRLGHGNISRLCSAAEKPTGKHQATDYHVLLETALCGKSCISTCREDVGIQGNKSKEAAMACLTACPLLEDMMEWSHWSLIFQPQHGPLRDFIAKYGGEKSISLEGGKKLATSNFLALETEPGKLLKICAGSDVNQFVTALECQDPLAAAGHLVGLIVTNKGLESCPLALLANHMKSCLLALHARSPGFSTPGGPPSQELSNTVDYAVQFVTSMLLHLPLRICVSVANQLLLEPLSKVVGSAKSKTQIAQACSGILPWQRRQLELLGCLLGLPEWSASLQLRYEFPPDCVTVVPTDDFLGDPDQENNEEDEAEEEDSESEEDSDIDDILCEGEEKADISTATEKEKDVGLDEKDKKEAEGEDEESSSEEESETSEEDDDDGDTSEEEVKEKEGIMKLADTSEVPEIEKMKLCDGAEQGEEGKPLSREELCQQVVDNIRCDEFGVGMQLDEKLQKVMQKQLERQGRALQRLSKDLYSKDTHFVLELIQNADDNAYPAETVPAVKFVIDFSSVTVLNNEKGFEEKNVRALCDVGKSTKAKHQLGYIGQKGIGFKSVFRVTSRPEVHSNGFHICFDVNSGPMGYILPHWIEEQETDAQWQTKITLPWTEEIKQHIKSHAARFNDIEPSLLLFLHRLKEITIENKVEGFETVMRREDLSDDEVQITHSIGKDRWLVQRKILDASQVSLQTKSGVEVDATEIALAFPLKDKTSTQQAKPGELRVFAFLPLRSYGFRFIIQGDFDVPSSREDVDRSSSWNQWLRNEIPVLFIEALEVFKTRPDMTPVQAVIQYLQFVPLEGEVMEFFKPVATQILTKLRATNCIPVLTPDKADVQWTMPSKTVVTHDSLVLEIISSDLLQRDLGLYYLHPQVAAALDTPLTQALGIARVTTDHLLHIGRSISQNWNHTEAANQVLDLAKWLACIYRSLDELQDNQQTMEDLRQMRVIPLSSGELVPLADVTIFMLTDGQDSLMTRKNKRQGTKVKDPLLELKKDLNLVHTELTNTPDNEINSQVVKLLIKMGIKQMTGHDLIHSHIMPILQSEQWKDKSEAVLISYLVYIKMEIDRNPSVVDMSQLKPAIRLVTNDGIKSPSQDDVHFSTAFGNKIDLDNVFPGLDWTLVVTDYLPHGATQVDIESWRALLSQLGVVDFLRVNQTELRFEKSTMHETAWAAYKEVWPDSPDGYVVTDFQCEEFYKLVTCNQCHERLYQQMMALYELLDLSWNGNYDCFVSTQLRSGSGHVLREVIESSFAVYLKTLSWVPAVWTNVSVQEDNRTISTSDHHDLLPAAELHTREGDISKLMAHTVKYLGIPPQRNCSFTKFLQIKLSVEVQIVANALISWGQRAQDTPDTPRMFCTTRRHVFDLYSFLNDNLSGKQCQDLFHEHPVIFYPLKSPDQINKGEILAGLMMKRSEVWWADQTGLMTKYAESLARYKSPLAKYKLLAGMYSPYQEMFRSIVRIRMEPSTKDFAVLLKHIATVHPQDEMDVLADALFLFSKIGSDLMKITDTVAGVKTPEAIKAETNLEPVKSVLTKAAVFPTKQGQWVSLSDRPMIVDSTELEQMFQDKSGVYFLQLDCQGSRRHWNRSGGARENKIEEESLRHCLSLFENIKPLSECIKTEEITSGFQQSIKGQNYMHKIVGPLQQFLYFVYPSVYKQVKEKKAIVFKDLIFSEVLKLEVRYELVDRPDVFVIQEEKCVVKDNHFYFHEKYVTSQVEINKEVAKFFSEGHEECLRELRSFLAQLLPILDGQAGESLEEFLHRQRQPVKSLPPDEEVWEIPMAIIPQPPEPEPELEEEATSTMVYGRALSVPEAGEDVANAGEGESAGLKSWPPRSAAGMDKDAAMMARTSGGGQSQSTMWPLPQAPTNAPSSKQLPSSIRVVKAEVDQEESETGTKIKTSRPGSGGIERSISSDSGGTGASTSRQTSQTGESKALSEQLMKAGEGQGYVRQTSGGHSERSGPSRQTSHSASNASQTGRPRVEGDNNEMEDISGEKRKRKLISEGGGEEVQASKKTNLMAEDEELVMSQCVGDGGDELTGETRGASSRHRQQHERMQEGEHNSAGSDTSSSREVTPSSSSSGQDVRRPNKKETLHFTIPLWNDASEEVVYAELGSGDSLNIPKEQLTDKAVASDIGRWGELLVLDYLKQLKNTNSHVEDVLWSNAAGEKGLPYDFEIVLRNDNDDSVHSVYIEVKATISRDKEIFQVSSNQIEFALLHRDRYEIYRVFGAGNRNPKLVRVENVAERMRTHAVQLFMVL